MAETVETGGLIGMFRRAGANAAASVSNHDTWAIRLVFVAGVATILHKAGLEIPNYAIVFGVCLGLAALLYEMNAATYALRSFWKGRPLSAIGWACIWCVAFGYSITQWVGAAGENEAKKSNIHTMAHNATVDLTSQIDAAKMDRDRVQARISVIEGGIEINGVKQAVRTIESAQADIDNAMAHRFWKLTNECKETQGRQTREFCNKFSAAKSERALAAELATSKAELPALVKAYNDLVAQRRTSKTETHAERNDMLLLTRYGGMKTEDAQAFTAVASILVISVFLSFATALREMEHLRSQGPRQKLLSGKIGAWLRGLMFGKRAQGDALVDAAIKNGRVEFNQTLEDNRQLPDVAARIAAMTGKYRVAA